MPKTLLERWQSKVVVAPSGCWEWTASRNRAGYGQLRNPGSTQLAHRIGWELLVGTLTPARELDHLCRNRACVNPDHLEEVEHRDNMRRSPDIGGWQRRKSVCKRGHALTGDNLYVTPDGRRQCRTCQNRRSQISRQEVK